jgi:GNAT superfamily N-acetyltransferase
VHPTLTARPATVDDVPELVRLRTVMWESMGLPMAEDGWRERCADVLAEWIASGTGMAFVVDGPDGLVACGVGSIDQRLPGSSNPSGRYGYIANMVTELEHRGLGLATAILRELLAWFTEQGIHTVELHASADGEPIYRAHGFTENRQPALRWRSA